MNGETSERGGPMIHLLTWKKLFTDSSAEAAAQVWSTLDQHHIPYQMKTVNSMGSLRRNVQSSMSMGTTMGGMPHSAIADQVHYVYVIYVRRRDYARAKALIGQGQ